ncbi:CYTH domain-containing protein [Candidatus Saccharibacteria bacterium]|nr:CYTH domain-containing protein [Candidatus Saccharibacteria bacterium]
MKTVIKKAKVKNHEDFEKKLEDIEFEFSPIIWQHDRVYLPKGFKHGMNYPRIIMRTEMKAVDKPAKYKMILKRHIEDSGVDVVDETEVKDYAEGVNIVHQLGFKKINEVSRRRQEIDMGDGTMLYLDNVEGVAGYYAKIETRLDEKDTVTDVVEDLTKTLKVLGAEEIVEKAYFEQLNG